MTLIKRSNQLWPDTMNRFFDDVFTRDWFDWNTNHTSTTGTTIPAVNIRENNDQFMVEMAAPGMSRNDFHIELDNETLTISSQKESSSELQENERFTRREFSYQSFRRSFQLPKSIVDDSKIKATYKDGVLQVLIPKKEEAKPQPPRKIAIS